MFLTFSCLSGHKDVPQWLYNLSKIDEKGIIDITCT